MTRKKKTPPAAAPAPAPPTGSFANPQTNAALQKRLRRIAGQVQGLQNMIDDNRYCIDVLTQVAAAQEGLRAVGQEIIRSHLRHCVRDAVDRSDQHADAIIEELLTVLKKYR